MGVQGKTYGIGLAGFGTVGRGVWDIFQTRGELLGRRCGERFEILRVLVRDVERVRGELGDGVVTGDWRELVGDEGVDVVVELIGGTTDAFEIVAGALRAGKPVVTGNKALLAERGGELFALSREVGVPIFWEAAVAGGIPVIRGLQDSLIGNEVLSLAGIINGTSNFVLQRMSECGVGFGEALEEAQRLGYAEADPSLDVNGGDAAHKALLLAALSYGFLPKCEEMYVDGIEQVRPMDIAFARQLGYVVKLLAVIRQHKSGAIELRVQPSFLSKNHILSSVNGVFNAVAVNGSETGEVLFYGRGAGALPTGSAVVADVVEAVRGLAAGGISRGYLPYGDGGGRVLPIGETETSYYVRFDVPDRPGVIAEIAQMLARWEIGISGTHSPVDPDAENAEFVDLVFLLHKCRFGVLQCALEEIAKTDCVKSGPVVFRIEYL